MPTHVLIVDDSILSRTKLFHALSKNKQIKIVGSTSSGKEVFNLMEKFNPQFVTLDFDLAIQKNATFAKQVCAKYKKAVIYIGLSSHADARAVGCTYVLQKPSDPHSPAMEAFVHDLCKKITAGGAATAATAAAQSAKKAVSTIAAPTSLTPLGARDSIIALGASTGGTLAIQQVVKDLPANCPPMVIVQHMPAMFTPTFAQQLNSISHMTVREAKHLDRLETGLILVAAGGYHLTVHKDSRGYYVQSKVGEKVSGHCPSVDVMFESVAKICGRCALGVILTGMGADGATGITHMHKKGSYTIGQDKDSCIVYGMPMEAHKLGGISRQLPLDRIKDAIIKHFKG